MSLESTPPALKNGALGIVSFVLSVVMILILFLDLATAAYANATGTATPGLNAIVGMVLFLCWFLGLIAIGLGVAGYRDKSCKPGFSVAGMGISAAAIILSLGLMILGLSHKG